MSCNTKNYDSRSIYEQNILTSYHSPVWLQNDNTRTQYDLNLQNQYLSSKDRYIPEFYTNFKPRGNQDQSTCKTFDNNIVKENYAGNALCNAPRTQYDLDMIQTFDHMYSNENALQKSNLRLFNNLSTVGNKVGYMCSHIVPAHHGSGH